MITVWMWILGGIAAVLLLAKVYWAFLLSMYPEHIHTTEVHTITTPDLWKLRLCRYRKGRTGGEPVLLVHGLNANQHNFTIPENDSLVDFLVSRGFDCWTIDLRGSRSSEPPFEHRRREAVLDDYLRHDLPLAVHYIREATRYDKIHWAGHSLGGMLLYAYVQHHGDQHIASGITLGAPIGFRGVDMQWLEDAVYFVKRFPGIFGRFFRVYIPMRGKLRVNIPLFPTNMRNLADGITASETFNLIDDLLPKVLSQMAEWASREEWVMLDGTLDVAGGLDGMRFPLLAFYGPQDPFIPLEHAKAFIDALPHGDKQMIVCSKENGCLEDYSHCELVFGKGAKREVFQPIARWIAEHPAVGALAERADDIEDRRLVVGPLDHGARAKILSGDSFLHVTVDGAGPDEDESD